MTIGSGSRRLRGAHVLLTAIAAVSWSFLAMAGVAAAGLHLLGADGAGALGPMTAAAIVLAVGGSVTPSGDVEAFGLQTSGAYTSIDIAPLGVSLAGALLLGWIFARSLRAAGGTPRPAELLARVVAVAGLFLLLLAGLAWAGEDTVTIDGKELGLGGGGPGGGPHLEIPGLGDIGGGLPDRLADLAGAKAAVGFSVRTGPSLLAGALWVLAVLVIALLVSRRAPLPSGWGAVDRAVRPAVSALCAVLVLAVGAGLAAAVYAATGDGHPRRVLGAALLGTPNGVWLGVPLGLLVPWRGSAGGALTQVLPAPLDELLGMRADETVTMGRLAEFDSRVWVLTVACALLMLTAGLLTAVRTPRGGAGPVGFAARCALRLALASALVLPLLVLLTRVKADASLSVFGFDVFGARLELSGSVPAALALGAAWGAGAGVGGALLAWATGAAGRRATAGAPGAGAGHAYPDPARLPGPYNPSSTYRPSHGDTNPYLRPVVGEPPRMPGAGDPGAQTQTWTGQPPLPPRPRPRYGRPFGTPPEEPPPPGVPGRRR
ncbi:streptophobe family protein [Streptomyces netropsis]|uniref:streptophobe family protein n=1 Tax=Streptomyces netropsis TaxID=55404 RepID=UPI0037A41008